ncbi:hypothetical protein N0V83_004654 [Neocucurbitaria cava]|uniref:Uncharacterized protein n=1 Tax=Neocucurbitaria cava TaxID=798079 RepID=A0A9W8Y9U4_9PLEO|nr:hypothetical protein N0V83_004654 [Neocucurbitaria cava]
MTPRTRKSNTDIDYKVYYSKKVPQQVHFPHKRKTVRRRSTPVPDGADKRQMVSVPEKMKAKNTKIIKDSDTESASEDEDLEEDGGVLLDVEILQEAEQSTTGVAKGKGRKRKSDTMNEYSEENEELVLPTPKRRRKVAAKKPQSRPRPIEADSEDEQDAKSLKVKSADNKSRRLRRQSTLTQLVDGRQASPHSEEPEFKPVKRSGRSTKKGKDKQQRTLTQMIPGRRSFEVVSDEDMTEALSDLETEEQGSADYGDVIAQRLAQQGLHHAEGDVPTFKREDGEEVHASAQSLLALGVQTVEPDLVKNEEESYQPTQYIDAPVTRTGPTRSRKSKQINKEKTVDTKLPVSRKSANSRFGLLSTPEKRRICEIPSSQSPADSPLSVQMSTHKTCRSPLKERSGNAISAPETPSKRKQVAFAEPSKEHHSPPTLRRFQSTVQDSEEEDEDIIEDSSSCAQWITASTKPGTGGIFKLGEAVGVNTQAILERIDQACARVDEDAACQDSDSSEELGVQATTRRDHEASPELGEQQPSLNRTRCRTASVEIKHELLDDSEVLPGNTVNSFSSPGEQAVASREPPNEHVELPTSVVEVHSTPPFSDAYLQDTFPSTPMVIQGESSDEDDAADSMPPSRAKQEPRRPPSSSRRQPSVELHDESVRVPLSPVAQRETQQSHSSKAEQQLQEEWLSYSQYLGTRPLESSSMHVAADAFSYNATPKPPRPAAAPPPPQHSGHGLSQATTVDEVTPKKNRRQRTISANVTPHKIASSQPFISPSKPPPLFIPSSFPSPAKAVMEGWSSPVYGRTQDFRSSQYGASLEDFSIPAPPPPLEDS